MESIQDILERAAATREALAASARDDESEEGNDEEMEIDEAVPEGGTMGQRQY